MFERAARLLRQNVRRFSSTCERLVSKHDGQVEPCSVATAASLKTAIATAERMSAEYDQMLFELKALNEELDLHEAAVARTRADLLELESTTGVPLPAYLRTCETSTASADFVISFEA